MRTFKWTTPAKCDRKFIRGDGHWDFDIMQDFITVEFTLEQFIKWKTDLSLYENHRGQVFIYDNPWKENYINSIKRIKDDLVLGLAAAKYLVDHFKTTDYEELAKMQDICDILEAIE